MKPKLREQIKLLRKARSFAEKMDLTLDRIPGSGLDEFLAACLDVWHWTNRNDPGLQSKVTQALGKHWGKRSALLKWGYATISSKADIANEDREAQEFFMEAGKRLVDACATGDSSSLRRLADSLDAWKTFQPQPHLLRSALLLIDAKNTQQTKRNTMREIIAVLPKLGVLVDENTPRRVRTLCKELEISIEGKRGRPKK